MSHVYPAVRRPPKSRIPSLRTSSHFRRHSSQLELLKQDLQRKIFIEREQKLRILSAKNLATLECVVTPRTRKVKSQPATLNRNAKVLGPIETTPKSTATTNRRYSLKSPLATPEFYDRNEPLNGITPGKEYEISNGSDSCRVMSPGMKLDFDTTPSYVGKKATSDDLQLDATPKMGGKLNKTPVLPPISSGSTASKPPLERNNSVHNDPDQMVTNVHNRQNNVPKPKEAQNFTLQPKTRRSPFPPGRTKSDQVDDRSAAPKRSSNSVKDQTPLPAQMPESEKGNLKLIIKRKEEELMRKIAAEEKRLQEIQFQEEDDRRRAQERRLQREEKKVAKMNSYKSEESPREEIPIENKRMSMKERKKSLPIEPEPVRTQNINEVPQPMEEPVRELQAQVSDSSQFFSMPHEGEQDQVSLSECYICGRKFGEDRLQKHIQVCNKLSQKKERKKFDMTKKRAEGTDYASYVARGAHLKEQPKAKRKDWKTAHQEFQQIVQYAKTGAAPPPVSNPDYETCQYCNRRFNEAAYQRHVVHCKEKSMRQVVVKKPAQKRR